MHDSAACPEVVLVFDEAEDDAGNGVGADLSLYVGSEKTVETHTAVAVIEKTEESSETSTSDTAATVTIKVDADSCTDLALRMDNACLLHHHNHRPLLDPRIAGLVSSISTAARISLRLASILVEAIFESLKFSASTSLAITRRAMVAAVSSARSLHLIAMGRGKRYVSLGDKSSL